MSQAIFVILHNYLFQKTLDMLEVVPIDKLILTILVLLLIFLYNKFRHSYDYWKKRQIPYLKPIVPFGNVWKVFFRKHSLGEAYSEAYLEFKKMGAKHGGIYVLNTPVYIPVDADIIKNILITDSENFLSHGFYANEEDDPLTAHIFNLEGTRWKEVRGKSAQAFTSAKMRKAFISMVNLAEQFQKRLDQCVENHSDGIDIRSELCKFTAEVVAESSFGMNINTLKGENEELLKHMNFFITGQWNLYKISMILALPAKILRTFNFRIYSKEITDFVKKLCLDLKESRKKAGIRYDDLANVLIELTKQNEEQKDFTGKKVMEPLSITEYIAQMWMFFCGSSESSASTLCLAVYDLATNPECQKKLREEINTVLARHNNEITYEAVAEMYYMDYVIDGKINN